ncbi:MAG: DUF2232 domain-containing protein [Gemmatimonadales bacterium]
MGFFLIAPSPLLFFLPLAALLIRSRPSTLHEWWWVAGSAALSAVWLVQAGGMTDQVVNAAAVLATGAFVCLLRVRRGTVFNHAAWALLLAFAAVAAWFGLLHLSWAEVQDALTREWWELTRQFIDRARQVSAGRETIALFIQVADAGRTMAALFPSRVFLGGILGLVLAATWTGRITGRVPEVRLSRFREFRFWDHLVWVLILALGVVLVPAPSELDSSSALLEMITYGVHFWAPVASNVLVVCGALYATRGAAIVRSILRLRTALILLAVGVVFLLPFTLIGLATFGLADTWVDFRRRFAEAEAQRPRR